VCKLDKCAPAFRCAGQQDATQLLGVVMQGTAVQQLTCDANCKVFLFATSWLLLDLATQPHDMVAVALYASAAGASV
jgi:hypothetical protein